MEETKNIPDHFRVATNEDFLCGNDPKLGMSYWIHSEHRPELQQYMLVQNTNTSDLSEWIRRGRCYIEESRYEGNNNVINLK